MDTYPFHVQCEYLYCIDVAKEYTHRLPLDIIINNRHI